MIRAKTNMQLTNFNKVWLSAENRPNLIGHKDNLRKCLLIAPDFLGLISSLLK